MFAQFKIIAPTLGGLALLAAAAAPGVSLAGERGSGGHGSGGYTGGSGCCRPAPPVCCRPDNPGNPHNPGRPPIHVPPIKITPPPIVIVPPNVNVNVNVRANASAEAYSSSSASASAVNNNTVIIGGGGGGGFGTPGTPAYVNSLNVEGVVPAVNRVPYQASRTQIKTVVIRAVCIDDREIPHPASQVFPGQDVAETYEGELFRCIAGTRLSVTWADWLGRVAFDGGTVINCAKGEAFWHGRGGEVSCRPQRPARDCNERSLLRRYGVGVKVFRMVRVETYTAYREEVVQQSASSVSGIVLDGGVGGLQF